MIEQTFVVKHGSDLYRKYYEAKSEKEHFLSLSQMFFKNHNLNPSKYCLTETLRMCMSSDEREMYKSQIKKYADENGMFVFKQNSSMQKAWVEEVVNSVNLNRINCIRFWWTQYIMSGSYALWDYNGDVYGLLKDKTLAEINLDKETFLPIKMSEYYRAYEESENK